MGFKMEYTLGGHTVSRDRFFDGIVERAGDAAIEGLRKRLKQIQCPEHRRTARVAVAWRSGSRFELSVDGCCDALVQHVHTAAG